MRFGPEEPALRPISLTPLIDVVFILLIFFMLASSFLDWHAVDLKLSGSAGSAQSAGESLVVRLDANGSLSLNGRVHGAGELEDAVARRLADRPDLPVVMRPGADVSLQRAVTVLDLLKRAGVSNLSLARDR